MPAQTKLSKTLINAYHVAHYRVTGAGEPFVLLVRKKSTRLAALLKLHHQESAMFLTACNPFSQKEKPTLNVRAQKALENEIRKNGWTYFEGFGEDPSGKWKVEPSFLVLGVSLEEAKELAEKHRQNAVIWCENDAVPQLILLR